MSLNDKSGWAALCELHFRPLLYKITVVEVEVGISYVTLSFVSALYRHSLSSSSVLQHTFLLIVLITSFMNEDKK